MIVVQIVCSDKKLNIFLIIKAFQQKGVQMNFTLEEYVELRDFCQSQINDECDRLNKKLHEEIEIKTMNISVDEFNTIIIKNGENLIKIYYTHNAIGDYEEGEVISVYPFIATYNTECTCHPTVRYYTNMRDILSDLKECGMLPTISTDYDDLSYTIGPDIIQQKIELIGELCELKK